MLFVFPLSISLHTSIMHPPPVWLSVEHSLVCIRCYLLPRVSVRRELRRAGSEQGSCVGRCFQLDDDVSVVTVSQARRLRVASVGPRHAMVSSHVLVESLDLKGNDNDHHNIILDTTCRRRHSPPRTMNRRSSCRSLLTAIAAVSLAASSRGGAVNREEGEQP